MPPLMAPLPVALLAEGVDRNTIDQQAEIDSYLVALLAEGVDRNDAVYLAVGLANYVALLAEGVDRNRASSLKYCSFVSRPPRGGRG